MENMGKDADKVHPVEKNTCKISEETARKQMQDLLDSYNININVLPEDQQSTMKYVVDCIVEAMKSGKIEILDDNTIKHNLLKPRGDVSFLIYQRLTGTAEREYAASKNSYTAHMAQMGSLCNLPSSAMSALDAIDRSVVQKISLLFTSV